MNKVTYKTLRIGDIVQTVSFTHKFNKDKLIAINTSDVYNGTMGAGTLTPINKLKGQFKKTIQKGDILFSEIRPANRRFAKVSISDCQDFVVSTKLMVLRKFNDKVDANYFFYCLTNQPFLDTLQRRAENRIGSFPQITFDILAGYTFPIPPLDEQKRIAKVIFNIDRKIELNKAINDNLEAMAKQLYDYWFVQFDFPNEEGKPYKSSGGAMVWNEKLKREIPKDWEVEPLNNWLDIKSGFAFKSETYQREGKYKIITIKNVQDHHLETNGCDCISILPEGTKAWCKLKIDDRLISLTGNCGRLCIVTEDNLLLNQRVGLLDCKRLLLNYAYAMLSSKEYQTKCDNLAKGAAQANLSPVELCKCLSILPSKSVIERFDKYTSPLIEKLIKCEREISTLTKQRDELLPLLMNGQATVNYHLSDD